METSRHPDIQHQSKYIRIHTQHAQTPHANTRASLYAHAWLQRLSAREVALPISTTLYVSGSRGLRYARLLVFEARCLCAEEALVEIGKTAEADGEGGEEDDEGKDG
jgi:hypothetical protein